MSFSYTGFTCISPVYMKIDDFPVKFSCYVTVKGHSITEKDT